MSNEKQLQQVPSNADGNLRETHDDESALHSDWSGDESLRESIGDGQPRDNLDDPQGELQVQDVKIIFYSTNPERALRILPELCTTLKSRCCGRKASA